METFISGQSGRIYINYIRQKLEEGYGSMLGVGRTMRDALREWPEYY